MNSLKEQIIQDTINKIILLLKMDSVPHITTEEAIFVLDDVLLLFQALVDADLAHYVATRNGSRPDSMSIQFYKEFKITFELKWKERTRTVCYTPHTEVNSHFSTLSERLVRYNHESAY